jgi:hypothetical protein
MGRYPTRRETCHAHRLTVDGRTVVMMFDDSDPPARLAVLRDNVLDLEIQVDDLRLELDDVVRRLRAAVRSRDDAAARLEMAVEQVGRQVEGSFHLPDERPTAQLATSCLLPDERSDERPNAREAQA